LRPIVSPRSHPPHGARSVDALTIGDGDVVDLSPFYG
jgi:hypothetical protein